MTAYFISENDFADFVTRMIDGHTVVAPVAKQNKFVFSQVNSVTQIRLDYDVTILPPKKEVFPTTQPLVKFSEKGFEGCVSPEEKILLGVHPYDVKAMDQLDHLFTENNKDVNYTANREQLTIIASNVQNVAKKAFFGTVGEGVRPKGHDAFLTKIPGGLFGGSGYLFDVQTEKGRALLKLGNFQEAKESQEIKASKINEEANEKCPEALNGSSEEIATKVRASFSKKEKWEGFAKDCFSCGSCNIVCPTCYCFDVQHKWNLDQTSGIRARSWDGCLLEDFSKVSLGGGAEENLREERWERFRHRIMRKSTYLNEKLGGPACVGCGRCSLACTADIADPVQVINELTKE